MNVFGKSEEKAQEWIRDMMACLDSSDEHQALAALRAGLHALRDRLTIEEAAQLAAQLPMTIRGLFFENWRPAGKPLPVRHADQFLELVLGNYQPRQDVYADDIVKAVSCVLRKHVSEGELRDVVTNLPAPIAALMSGLRSP